MNVRQLWKHEDEALLIDLVHQYPPLWDTADENYTKNSIKRHLYSQIAEDLKKRWPNTAYVLNSSTLRLKFCNLRTYFIRERRKMKTERDHSKWIHFDRMMFLPEDDKNKFEKDLDISIVEVKGGTMNDNDEMEHNASVPETSCSDSDEGTDSSLSLQQPVQSDEKDSDSPLKQASNESCNNSFLLFNSIKTETPIILKAWSTTEGLLISKQVSNENRNSSSPVCNSDKAEAPVILKAWSSTEGLPLSKQIINGNPNNSSTACNSAKAEAPVILKALPSTEGLPRSKQMINESPNSSSPACNSAKAEAPVILKTLPSTEGLPSSKKIRNGSPNSSSLVCDSTNTETPAINTRFPAKGPSPFNVALGNLVVASLNQMPVEKANAATKDIFDVLLKHGSESNHLQ